MNILSKVTWEAMKKNKTRTIVTIIGIVLSAAMFMAVTTAAFSGLDFVIRGTAYTDGDYFVAFDGLTDAEVEELQSKEIVTQLADFKLLGFTGIVEREDSVTGYLDEYYVAAVNQTFFEKMPVHLLEGRLPENSSEIIVPEQYVKHYALNGVTIAVNDEITQLVQTRLVDTPDPTMYNEYPYDEWEETYTIVGIYEDHRFPVTNQYLQTVLTVDDGNQHSHLHHRVFVKTSPAKAAFNLGKENFGTDSNINTSYLRFFGATPYDNYNTIIYAIVAVLLGIIMVAAVSSIHNAFSISVSERTKQFGLLSGVGATRKQIRRSVLFEAGIVCLIGIPIGLVAGYIGVAILLISMNEVFKSLFSFGGVVDMIPILSLPAALIATAVCILTVYISAWIPSKRATKVTAIEAIRQTTDYKATAKQVKTGKLTGKFFGLPGLMSRKYYKISSKKYRSTIVSLTISLVLFVVASYFSSLLANTFASTMGVRNFDAMLTPHNEAGIVKCEEIRDLPGVGKAVFVDWNYFDSVIATKDYSEKYLDLQKQKAETYYNSTLGENYDLASVKAYYLEDEEFFAYLKEHNFDASKYQDPENPTALVLIADYRTPFHTDEKGQTTQQIYHCSPVSDSLEALTITNILIPPATDEGGPISGAGIRNFVTDEGVIVLEFQTMETDSEGVFRPTGEFQYLSAAYEANAEGNIVCNYYSYDPETKEVGTTVLYTEEQILYRSIRLGDRVEDVPFGIDIDLGNICIVLPLSAYKPSPLVDDKPGIPNMALKIDDYNSVIDILNAYDNNGMYVDNYLADEMNQRGLVRMIRIMSFGFIILISLISVTNVFNTISTNIMLRKRDFGMLRSVGMRNRGIYRMMAYECLLYGTRALLWGVPISIALSYGCYRIADIAYVTHFKVPLSELLLAASIIFAVVAITMFYAVSKLRKDNPIDAIRMENT